ncbi:MAG: hypothetical protein JO353_04180 [Phycisphaerae bacterium]|nr:hypothetical protein [Phycisphaerae bacterium]
MKELRTVVTLDNTVLDMTYRDNPTVPDATLALAADYSDALLTARRAKNLIVLLLLLMLLGQLGLFFTAKYSNAIPVEQNPTTVPVGRGVDAAMSANSATPSDVVPTVQPSSQAKTTELLQYFVALTEFLGVALSVVLAVLVLVLVMIMLVGRLVGVSRVVSAFVWSLLLIVLLFPWQAFLADVHFASDFKIPGVLYTWAELVRFAKLGVNGNNPGVEMLILHWGRFVAFPVLTVIITLAIQIKTNRGLREALGEVDAVMGVPTA